MLVAVGCVHEKRNTMAQARIKIAKPDIVRLFEELPRRILRRTELSQILSENREFWRLTQNETVNSFIDFLTKRTKLKRAVFKFPNRTETRYTWGEVPFYELLMSIKADAYFSHYSAMYLNELTDQVPKTMYLNDEQSPKPAPVGQLVQERIDGAFRRPQRASSNRTKFGGYTICLLNGKNTGQLGVIEATGPDDAVVRVAGPERTLIDVAVRPNYAGGVFEVLEAYRRAHDMISANRLSAFLKQLSYVYPYRQAIGFYLDRAGHYNDSQIALFRKTPFEVDFYLAHGMKDVDYCEEWRLFVPKGL